MFVCAAGKGLKHTACLSLICVMIVSKHAQALMCVCLGMFKYAYSYVHREYLQRVLPSPHPGPSAQRCFIHCTNSSAWSRSFLYPLKFCVDFFLFSLLLLLRMCSSYSFYEERYRRRHHHMASSVCGPLAPRGKLLTGCT